MATFLLFILVLSGIYADTVISLDSSNFDKIINGSVPALIKFYVPWCRFCRNLAPIYQEVAYIFKDNKELIIAQVDCDANEPIREKWQISGYPTLKWISNVSKDGEDYDGELQLKAIETFVLEKIKSNHSAPVLQLDKRYTEWDLKNVKSFQIPYIWSIARDMLFIFFFFGICYLLLHYIRSMISALARTNSQKMRII